MICRRSQGRSGRGVRIALGAGLTLALALTATGVHAAWTAHTQAQVAASTASTAMTTNGLAALSHSYAAASLSPPHTVSVTNNGSTPLTLRSVAVTTTGTAPAEEFVLHLWPKTSDPCALVPPAGAWSQSLSTAVAPLTGFPELSAGHTLDLCAITEFMGTPTAVQRQLVATIDLTAGVGDHWMQADQQVATGRTFAQVVLGATLSPPIALTCTSIPQGVLIEWEAVNGRMFNVYFTRSSNGERHLLAGPIPQSSFAVTTIPGNGNRDGVVTVHSVVNGVESEPSESVALRVRGPNINCQ